MPLTHLILCPSVFSILTAFWLTEWQADSCKAVTKTAKGLAITSNQHLYKMVIADTVLSFIVAWPMCVSYSSYFFHRFTQTEHLGAEDIDHKHIGKSCL